ncbi:MAG: nuclear transport factor 2 family protein [Sinomicrobium sp.]|nr:nuclear transport factor 2 family protein [Sinomicrobium sp.]
MKFFSIVLTLIIHAACTPDNTVEAEKKAIHTVLDSWHKAAADADFETYFSKMTPDGVFIGTDATENWQNSAFRAFSKPYFDKGKAWSFTSVERNVYVDETLKTAWFDELLNTRMKLCRGSGVLKKTNGQWKIAHYVLSITIPNEDVESVVQLKTAFDDALLKKLEEKQ